MNLNNQRKEMRKSRLIFYRRKHLHISPSALLSFLDSSMSSNIQKSDPSRILKKTNSCSERFTMPKEIPLNLLVYHFKWDICKITPTILQERIRSVEGHLKENSSGILPQSYCLLAYLKSKVDTNEEVERNNEIYSILLNAEDSLSEVHESSTKKGLGYKAIVIGNLIYWEQYKIKKYQQARNHFEEYKKLKERYDGYLECHPEVLAMKAFAFGYSFGIDKSRLSVDAYTKALSDKDYMNNAKWIFGLARSKSIIALREEPQRESELTEIEKLLRRALHIDPDYSLAMLKLAKTLVKLNGINVFEEVEDLIEKALDASNRKVSCLEQAASIYQQALKHKKGNYVTTKNRIINNEKAMKLYKEAEEINPSSKRTIIGIGKCYLNKYYDSFGRGSSRMKELCNLPLPKDLKEALDYFEKDNHKRHTDKLKLAQVYTEVSLFKGKEEFRLKAENIYMQVISLTEQEQDHLRLVEACSRYAKFLRINNRVEEEIEYLIKAVDVTVENGQEEDTKMRFSRECQDRLLFYASQDDYYMPRQKSLAVKAHVQRKRGNVMTSCYYLNQALKLESTGEFNRELERQRAECILQASEVQQPVCAQEMSHVYLDEAKEMIAALDDTEQKCNLEFEAESIEINKLMGEDEELRQLKKHRLKFEKCRIETNKQRLKRAKQELFPVTKEAHQRQEKENEEDTESKILIDVICETKRVLDRAMNTIKEKIFRVSSNLKPSCYYPTPKAFTLPESRNLRDQMKHLLEIRYKLENFADTLPEFFNFLIEKQPDPSKKQYKWLQDVIDIRNESEHATKSKEMLRELCPTRESERILAEQISKYAVEIKRRVQFEVRNYSRIQKTKVAQV